MTAQKKDQTWFCDKCRQSGAVTYEADADVMSVVQLVEDDHIRVSPGCDQPVMMLRVVGDSFAAS